MIITICYTYDVILHENYKTVQIKNVKNMYCENPKSKIHR